MLPTTIRRLSMTTAAVAALAAPLLTAPAATARVTSMYVADSVGDVLLNTGVTTDCVGVTLSGPGVATPPALPFSFTSSTWVGCTGLLGLTMSITQLSTWTVTGSGGSSVAVNNIDVHVKDDSTGGGICSFDVSGNTTGTYNSSTQILSINGSGLATSSIIGCFGVVTNPASLTGTFHVTSA